MRVELDKPVFRYTGKCKQQGIAKVILKNNKLSRVTLLDNKAYFKAVVVKIMWF